jgi:CHAT domain-containing protein/tetratricopeptide (TPR) repeat protein
LACFDAALANLHAALAQYPEAGALAERILPLCARYEITGGPLVVTAMHCRALHHLSDGELPDAEKLWGELLALQEKERDALLLPRTLNYLGLTAELQGRARDAEPHYRRAVKLQENNPRALPATHFISLWRLAEVTYPSGRRAEALRLLEEAVRVAETARLRLYGDANQRAAFFAQFVMAFERLVDWNVREGRLEDAFRMAARGRSRTLFDQLQLAGVDPRQGLSGPDGERLRREEARLRQELAAIQARAQLIPVQDAEGKEALALFAQLEKTQEKYAGVWREILNANPLYRGLSAGQGGDTLADLRERVLRRNNLLLLYWIGRERSYLFLVGDRTRSVECFPLTVPEGAASALARAQPPGGKKKDPPETRGFSVRPAQPAPRPAGPAPAGLALDQGWARLLVDRYLEHILASDGEGRRGFSLKPRPGGQTTPVAAVEMAGAAFLPEPALRRLRALEPDHLLVIPDGPLHKLPLEALVLRRGGEPRYALDELPPLIYAPSAAVLAVLPVLPNRRPLPAGGAPSLLTVGDVAYAGEATGPAEPARAGAGVLSLLGAFPRLQFSGVESRRIRGLFAKGQVVHLEGAGATEKAVTAAVAGRRFLHLATHGFVDERYGNLFGGLALAPPARGPLTPGDDGLLTLQEIYQLPLGDCELAVLSACVTNVGPQRPLEAGVTLAGGFLAAGARRVVASHWSVDDESTAELMAAFFERVTARDPVSFAHALRQARQHVRDRSEKWASPFYWAPFVLTGSGD